jgi:predicted Zn-dependent protease
MSLIETFQAMLAKGQDNALLRYSLGNAYLKEGNDLAAIKHLYAALDHNPKYSAAWKLLGRALSNSGQSQQALKVFEQGIAVAENQGDQQAAKEMRVFKRRLEKALSGE